MMKRPAGAGLTAVLMTGCMASAGCRRRHGLSAGVAGARLEADVRFIICACGCRRRRRDGRLAFFADGAPASVSGRI